MKFRWSASICALLLLLGLSAVAQNDSNAASDQQDSQNNPVLKTRPADQRPSDQWPAGQRPNTSAPTDPNGIYGAPPDAVPEGKRFIIKLKDTLDTKKLSDGKHFKAELREDLLTPSGLLIPKGRTVKGHVARFERGYTGSRMLLALDEIETRHGWVPLIGTVTGVPGDSSIKSTEEEGELSKKGPNTRRVLTNAAIGAAVGAVSGSVIAGGRGAAIGAAAGAGVGGGTGLLLKGGDMKLEKGTQLEVRLERDLTVPRDSR